MILCKATPSVRDDAVLTPPVNVWTKSIENITFFYTKIAKGKFILPCLEEGRVIFVGSVN